MNKKVEWLIGKSIREAKYLRIKYKNKSDITTEFWICILDIYSSGKIKIKGFNVAKEGSIDTELEISQILEAEILRFSYYDVPAELLNKIENDESLNSLELNRYNHQLLNYYIECYRANHDPFLHKAHLIPGLDLEVLGAGTDYDLEDAQFNKIIKNIYSNDYNKYYEYELAISEFSIDVHSKGKYIVAFRKLQFDPIARKLHISPRTSFNPHFYLKNEKYTLSYYSEMNSSEFENLYFNKKNELIDLLNQKLNTGEQVNTRPEMVVLGYRQIDISSVYDDIHADINNKQVEIPLNAFFQQMSLLDRQNRKEPQIVLFDKNANIHQINTVYNSLKYPITYVQGPPGTGKTQTILNILVNCLINRRTALVTSNNNVPINGIIEKLNVGTYKNKQILLPILRLGNKEYNARAIKCIKERFQIETNDIPKEKLLINLKEKSKEKNKEFLEKLKNHDARLKLEQNLGFVQRLLKEGRNILLEKEESTMISQLEQLAELHDSDLNGFYEVIKENHQMLQFFYFESLKYLKILQDGGYDELKEIVQLEESEEQLREFNRWIGNDKNMEKLASAFPIILTTNLSSRKLGSKFKFDLLIMDEAGQCDVATSLIPISKCKNMVLIGDTNQLKPIVTFEESRNQELMKKYEIDSDYDYYNNSILSLYRRIDNISADILLKYHYRCGRKIINYSNKRYYQSKLDLSKINREGSLTLLKVTNRNSGGKNSTLEESNEIINYIKNNNLSDVFIITPFRNQAEVLRIMLEKAQQSGEVDPRVNCGTIHKIQGQENKTIILSTSISNQTTPRTYNWIKDNNELLNVAITRAKENLIVVADTAAIDILSNKKDDLYSLIEYVKNNGNIEIQQSTTGRFTIGFSNNSENEDEFYKTMSHYCSVKGSSYARNVKVLNVFPEEFNNAELKNKEFDGVLYEGRIPKVVFEINGIEHYRDKKRIKSDKLKMKLLQEKGIPLVFMQNSLVKHYEFITNLLNKIKGGVHQTSLFNN